MVMSHGWACLQSSCAHAKGPGLLQVTAVNSKTSKGNAKAPRGWRPGRCAMHLTTCIPANKLIRLENLTAEAEGQNMSIWPRGKQLAQGETAVQPWAKQWLHLQLAQADELRGVLGAILGFPVSLRETYN